MIKSGKPCLKIPGQGAGHESRCLNFRVFDKSNFSLEDVRGGLPSETREYYNLREDQEEKNNLFRESQHKPSWQGMEKKLSEYIAHTGQRAEPQETIQYTKQQLETLKSLGYIQ